MAEEESNKTLGDRWTPLLAKTNHTVLVNGFLDYYSTIRVTPEGEEEALRLRAPDAMLIIHLMRYKWDQKAPHPSYAWLADNMGVTIPAIRKILRKLEKMKLVIRDERREATEKGNGALLGQYFKMDGLFQALEAKIGEAQPKFVEPPAPEETKPKIKLSKFKRGKKASLSDKPRPDQDRPGGRLPKEGAKRK